MIEAIDQEIIDARIEMLLGAWGYTADDLASEEPAMQASVHAARQRAYEAAAAFPGEISDELFAEYIEEGLVR